MANLYSSNLDKLSAISLNTSSHDSNDLPTLSLQDRYSSNRSLNMAYQAKVRETNSNDEKILDSSLKSNFIEGAIVGGTIGISVGSLAAIIAIAEIGTTLEISILGMVIAISSTLGIGGTIAGGIVGGLVGALVKPKM